MRRNNSALTVTEMSFKALTLTNVGFCVLLKSNTNLVSSTVVVGVVNDVKDLGKFITNNLKLAT